MNAKLNMNKQELLKIDTSISLLASSIERKVFYFLFIGILSSIAIGWQWIDIDNLSFWSAAKISLLALPIIIWFIFWQVIQQLTSLPETMEELKDTGKNSIELLRSFSTDSLAPKNTFRRVFGIIRTLRNPEIIHSVLACVKGLAILMNPLLLFALFLSCCAILLFAFIALIVLIF